MTTIRCVVPVCALAAGLALVTTVSAGKGPAPGVQLEGRGVASVGGAVRYATRELAGSTQVTAFDPDGRKLRQSRGTASRCAGRDPSTRSRPTGGRCTSSSTRRRRARRTASARTTSAVGRCCARQSSTRVSAAVR